MTSRYCQNPTKWAAPRAKLTEANLLYIMDEIRSLRRRDRPKPEKLRLEREDTLECQELRHYYVAALIGEVARLLPKGMARGVGVDADARKAREQAQERARARRASPEVRPRGA